MNYTVYKHTNLKNGKIYVGITQQKAEKRWERGHGYQRQPYFRDAIKNMAGIILNMKYCLKICPKKRQ